MTAQNVAVPVAPTLPTELTPVPLTAVRIDGGFLARLQRRNADGVLDHTFDWLERAGWTGNFRLAASGALPTGRQGREFADSEVYKVLEAHSWEFARTGDPQVAERIAELTDLVAAAQEPDGYVNTSFGRPGQEPSYSDLEWGHELYCFGHLLQAAVARGRTVGLDDPLVAIGCRVADHVCAEFGPDARNAVCGHPEIELGLLEFGRLTGQQRYVDQAGLFLARRGHGTLGPIQFPPEYFQDDMPIRDATVLRGHAVRALYLSAAAVDAAVETGDHELLAILERQWEATVARRTYLTGGMGSHHTDEAFGDDFELPPDRAYCESCASVAAFMLSWRLLLSTGNERYADFMERLVYNVIATASAEDGHAFFYTNTLHQRTATPAPPAGTISRAGAGARGEWFDVSCCPPNVSRTMASLGAYLASTSGDGIRIHQYASADLAFDLPSGRTELRMDADYPRSGRVTVTVVAAPAPVTLGLRVPGWGSGATLEGPRGTQAQLAPGVASVTVLEGDTVVLTLPMAPRFTFPDPRIDAVRGCVAVERGPEVLCLESIDLPSPSVDEVVVDATVPPIELDGVITVAGAIHAAAETPWPYGDPGSGSASAPTHFTLRPYHDWANRGPSTMRIWLRRE